MYTKEILDIDGSPMETLVFKPEGAGPFPGLMVAQHLPLAHTGLENDPFTIDVGEKLAAHGYASVTPFVFHWCGGASSNFASGSRKLASICRALR